MAGNVKKSDNFNEINREIELDDFDFKEIDIEQLRKNNPKNLLKFRKEENKKSNENSEVKIGSALIDNGFEEKPKRGRKKKIVEEKITPENEEEVKPKKRGRKKKEDKIEEIKIGNALIDSVIQQNDEEKQKRTRKKKEENIGKISLFSTKKTEHNKELNIRTDEEEQTIEINLKDKNFKVDIQLDEFDVYTSSNAKSYIIAKQPKLELNYGNFYLDITRNDESFTIETNEDIELDYVVKNLIKTNEMFSFTVSNLSEIETIDGKLKLKIDEEKMLESKIQDNKVLLISEEEGKVYLPYTKADVKRKIEESRNTDIEEIIEKNYIIPMEKYKSSIKARFREGYNLMRNKEGKSKKNAIMLGLELMFEFNLHPAIISACRNLEELDIYLDCLEDNELEKFSCFKIVYKAVPIVKKDKKNQAF